MYSTLECVYLLISWICKWTAGNTDNASFVLQVTKEHPLLINCSAYLQKEREFLIIGGGGNLFSFGSCINSLATMISIN